MDVGKAMMAALREQRDRDLVRLALSLVDGLARSVAGGEYELA